MTQTDHTAAGREGKVRQPSAGEQAAMDGSPTQVPATAATAQASPQPTPAAADTQFMGGRPDPDAPAIATARAAARKAGHRVAIDGMEDETSETYADPDGKLSSDFHVSAVRVPTAEGWEPINTSLEHRGTGLVPAASPLGIVVGTGADRNVAAATDPDGTAALTWTSELPTPTVNGSSATFAGVGQDENLVVTDTTNGYSADVVLPVAPSGTVGPWTFHFAGVGMVLKQSANDTVTLVDPKTGALRGAVGDPLVYGAAGPSVDGSTPTGRANLQVLPDPAGGQDLIVSMPEGFLASPGLRYPVTVDPTLTLNTGVSDTFVQSTDAANAHDGQAYLHAGYNGSGVFRTLIGFNTNIVTSSTGSQWLPPASGGGVTDAVLNVYNYNSNACGTSPNSLNVFEMTQSWSAPAVTWNQNVTAGAKMLASTTAATGASGCPAGGYLSVDVAQAGKDWYGGTANNGFELAASNEGATSDYRQFYAEENGAGTTPTLTLTYYYYPDPPSISVTPGNASVTASFAATSNLGGYTSVSGYNYAVENTTTSQALTPPNPVSPQKPYTQQTSSSTVTISPATGWNIVNGNSYEVFATTCVDNFADCSSTASLSATVTPTTYPGQVQQVSTSVGNQSVTAGWTAPANNGGSAVTSYAAFLYPAGSQYCATNYVGFQIVGATTNVTFSAATPGTAPSGAAAPPPTNGTGYALVIFARNGSPQSATTNNCSENTGYGPGYLTGTLTPFTVPSAPGAVTATPGNGTVTFTSSAPASNGGQAINHYYYGVYDTTTASYTTLADAATPSATAPATNGDSVYIVIEACNSADETSCGAAAGSNTVIPSGPPGAVGSLSATAAGRSVSASWTAPAATNGSALTGYQAYLYPSGSQFCQSNYLAVTTVTGTMVTFNATTPGTSPTGGTGTVPSNASSYVVEVFARNGSPSATSTNGCATPAGTGPGTVSGTVTPSSPPTAPNTVNLAGGNAAVTVSWTPPADNGGYAVSAYNYYFVDTTTNTTFGSGTTNGSGTGTTVAATNGDTVVAYVQDCTSPGTYCSPYEASNPVVPSGPPSAVQSLSATALDSQVGATWTAPAATNGSALTGYTAYLYPNGSQYCQNNYTAKTTVAGTSVTFSASSPGTAPSGQAATAPVNGSTYVVEVFAVNGSPATTSTNGCATPAGTGPGTLSNAVEPLGLPGMPVLVTATPQGQNLLVAWQPPLNNSPSSPTYPGAPVDAYTVIVYPSGSDYPNSDCVGIATTTGTATSVTITATTGGCTQHLQPGGAYVVRVAAHDASQATTTVNGAAESPGYGQPAPLTQPVVIQAVADSDLGLEPWWSFYTKPLGGGGTASVNVANGNLVVDSQDGTPIQAHGHIAFELNRVYNSRQLASTSPASGTVGKGWQFDVGSTGDDEGDDAMGAAALTLSNTESLAVPQPVTLVDRDGTRHVFAPRQSTIGVTTPTASTVLKGLLTPTSLTTTASVCIDQTYTAPPGVHLALWRYLALGSGTACPTASAGAPTGTVVLGYATERPDGLRTEYDGNGRVTSVRDRSGVELDYLYSTTGSGTSQSTVVRDVYERTSCVAGGSAASPDGTANATTPATLGESTCRAYRFTYSTDTANPCPVDPNAASSVCVLDPAGRTTRYEIDSRGYLVTVVNPDTTNSTITYEYAGDPGCPSEPPANGAAALLCSASDLDADSTTFGYSPDPTASSLPPVLTRIVDRGQTRGTTGYPTTLAYSTAGSSNPVAVTSTTVDSGPSTASDCTQTSTVCERTLYSGIDGQGRVGLTQRGASSVVVNGTPTANPPSAGAPGTWQTSTTTLWDGDADPQNNGQPATCETPDNADNNNLCRTTAAGSAGDPDETTNLLYGVDGEVLRSSTVLPGGNLDTTNGYHEQDWTTSSTTPVTTGDYAVDANRGVTPTTIASPNSGNVLFTLTDHTQTLDPRGNAAGATAYAAAVAGGAPTATAAAAAQTAAAPYLRTWYPDDVTTGTSPNTFPNSAAATSCSSSGSATGDTGLDCETDTPASAPSNGNAATTPKAGSCQGAAAATPYACSVFGYDQYGQRTSALTPVQAATGGKPYTYSYASDHPVGGTDPKTLDAAYTGPAAPAPDADTNAGGWLLAVTDPTGAFTYNSYDRAGNRVRTWDRDATVGAANAAAFDPTALSTYPHYASTVYGSLTSPWRYTTSSSTQLGETTTRVYDPEGRLTASTSPRGNPLRGTAGPTNPAFTTTYGYDARSEQTSATLPVGNTGLGGASLAANSRVAGTTVDTYDAYGNKTTETRPKANTSDPVAPATEWTYDPDNRPTLVAVSRTTDPTQGSASQTCQPTSTDPVFVQNSGTPVYVCTTSSGYDTLGNVITQTAADGGVTTAAFDAAGRKTSTTTQRTTSKTLVTATIYDADGNATDACPPREMDTADGGTGTCTDTTAYASRTFSTHTVYDAADRPAAVTRYRAVDPSSPVAKDSAPQAATLAATQVLTTSQTYDLDGDVLTSTDADKTATTTSYDALDRKTSQTVPHANPVAGTADTTASYTTAWTYDPVGDTLSTTLPQGVDSSGNAQPRITAYAYDPDHRLTETVTGSSTTAADPTPTPTPAADGTANERTRQFYDADGNTVAVTDPRAYTGGVPTYGADPTTPYVLMTAFDADDRPDAQYVPRSTTDTKTLDGGTSDAECPAATATTVDTSQQGTVPVPVPGIAPGTFTCVMRTAHDARGNTTLSGLATSTGVQPQTSAGQPNPLAGLALDNRYDAYTNTLDDNVVATTTPDPSRDGSRESTTLLLDGMGRTVSETDPGNGATTAPTTTTGYNLDGTVATVTAPPTTTTVNGTTATTSKVTTTSYNDDGNPTSVTTGSGSATHTTHTYYSSDSSVSDSLDTGGDDTRYAYDKTGNTAAVESPDEVAGGSAWATRDYYTADDQLASTVTPVNPAASPPTVREVDYAYDPAGRKASTHTYLGSESTPGAAVNLTADGGTTSQTYSPTDLVLTQDGRTTGTPADTITTVHDAAGNATNVHDSSNGGSTVAMTYTPDDLVATYSEATGTSTTATPTSTDTYAYDGAANLTARQETGNTSAHTITYAYDDAEQPTAVTDNVAGASTSPITFAYEPNGSPSQRTDPQIIGSNGQAGANDTTTWNYYGDGTLKAQQTVTSAGIQASAYAYAYDELGRVATQTATSTSLAGTASGQYAYAYDTAGRLASFQMGATAAATTVKYDANGNRTSYGKQTFTYNDDNQLLSSVNKTGSTGVSETDDTYAYYAWGGLHYDASTAVPAPPAIPLPPTIPPAQDQTTTTCYLYDAFDRTTTQSATLPQSGTPGNPTTACTGTTATAGGESVSTYDGLDRQRTTMDTKVDGSARAGTTTDLHYTAGGSDIAAETPVSALGTNGTDTTYTTTSNGDAPLAVTNGNAAGTLAKSQAQFLLGDGQGNTTTGYEESTTTTVAGTTSVTAGSLACSGRFDPFGSSVNAATTPSTTTLHPNGVCVSGDSPDTQWFQGSRRDDAMGTYQLGARTYNPATAAFTTPDSYRSADPSADLSVGTDPLTANTYTYVNGDPVNETDPSGHVRIVGPDGESLGAEEAQDKRDAADAANLASANRQASRDQRLYGEDDRSDYLNADNRGKAEALAEAQDYQLSYDIAQHKAQVAAQAAAAAAAQEAAAVKAASKHHCSSWNFACKALRAGEGTVDAVTSFGAGAVNGVVSGVTFGAVHTHLSACVFGGGDLDEVCKVANKVGDVTGQVGVAVGAGLLTGGAADVAEGGALVAEGSEAVADGADAAEAADTAAEGEQATEAGEDAAEDSCPTAGGQSFTAGTWVLMADGTSKAIDRVRVGDRVLARDPRTGKTYARTVTTLWVNRDTDLMDVEVTAGGRESTVHATSRHLFWDATTDAWTRAQNLRGGDRLTTADGTVATVERTIVVPGAMDMWDLTVTTTHDFYVLVGGTAVLVHNIDCGPSNFAPGRLASHFADHVQGARNGVIDSPEFADQDSYLAGARELLDGAPGDGVSQFIRKNGAGDLVRFNEDTGMFGAKTSEGVLKTFFRPTGGMDYFLGQVAKDVGSR